MKLTKQQTDIIQAVVDFGDQPRSFFIDAKAGSAKTTTILEACRMLSTWHPTRRAIVVAFNKSIATEIGGKLQSVGVDPSFISAATLNSIGHRILVRKFGKSLALERSKASRIIQETMRAFGEDTDDWEHVMRLVQFLDRARALDISHSEIDWDEVAENCEEILEPGEHDILRHSLAHSMRDAERGIIDFNDQLYVPVINEMQFSQYFDVFVDEAQDLSPIQIRMIQRMVYPSGGRCIAVGDRHQAIYAFRGADAAAVATMRELFNMLELPLSISFRCAKDIITEAQRYVPDIEPWDQSPAGAVSYREGPFQADEFAEDRRNAAPGQGPSSTYILCRLNAPLFRVAYVFLQRGLDFQFDNAEFVNKLKALIKDTVNSSGKRFDWKKHGGMRMEEFIPMLDSFAEAMCARLQGEKKFSRVDAFMDRVNAVRYIAGREDTNDLSALRTKIEFICRQNERSKIKLSTIHKSKGREAPEVIWLDLPGREPSNSIQAQQEVNLRYVATTRAQRVLTIYNSI